MIIDAALRGERLDKALASLLEGVSVREIRQALKDGRIRIDGRPAKPGSRAAGGEQVDLGAFVPKHLARVFPDETLRDRVRVLHEDEMLLVLDKPSGIPTHPAAHREAGTLLGAAVARCPEIEGAGPPLEGGLCHRLDTETSGCVVFAKTKEVRAQIRHAFDLHQVDKEYQALVFDRATLAAPSSIDAMLSRRGARVRVDPRDGLEAKTEVLELRRSGDVSLVRVRAQTGRRHQVRVHLASVHAPILGDERYGSPDAPTVERLCLHASLVRLPTGLCIEAPLPADFQTIAQRFGLEEAQT